MEKAFSIELSNGEKRGFVKFKEVKFLDHGKNKKEICSTSNFGIGTGIGTSVIQNITIRSQAERTGTLITNLNSC